MAARYSAGRIFLQVVPSFKGVQRETAREVEKVNRTMSKGMEDGAEKAGRKAGKTAGRNFMEGFGEGTLKENSKYQIALARQVGKYHKGLKDQQDKFVKDTVAGFKRAYDWSAAEAEKGAKKRAAAEAKAAKDAQRELRRQMRARYAEAEKLAKEKAAADARADRAEAKRLEGLHRAAVKQAEKTRAAILKADEEAAARRGGAMRKHLDRAIKGIDDSIGTVDLSTKIGRDLEQIRQKGLQVGKDLNKGLIPTDEARVRLSALGRDLQRLGRAGRLRGLDTGTRGNISSAVNEIRDMERATERATNTGSRFSRWLRGISGDGQDGANAFRIFNYRVLGIATLLPLLVPLLASAGAGIVAIGTAALGAATGLGVLALGFSGLSDAVKAMGEVQDNRVKDNLQYEKTMRNAARGVRDAQQGLTRAQRDAARAQVDSARAITDAQKRVDDARKDAARQARDSAQTIANAERKVADSQRDALKAQQDLADARREAQKEQQDLADKIAAGKLDERQALIDLFNAQVDYNSAMQDGGATNLEKEQAAINLERARLAIKGIRKENKQLAEDQKKAASGPDSNEGVIAAQQRVADSQQAIKDAEQDLADARRDAAEKAVESQQKIADAIQGVKDAQQNAADSAIDNQDRLRDAQERLTDAQAAYQEALTKTGEVGSASLDKLNTAMAKLSPAGQRFARYLFSLRQPFYDLRAIAQEGLLPGVEASMRTIMTRYGPGFTRFVGTMAKGMGDFFVQASKAFTSPIWAQFFATMEKMAPLFGAQFGTTFLNLLTGMAGIMTAFAPLAKDMGDAMVRLSGGFAEWGASLGKSKGFQSFLGYIEKTGPKVWKLIENIVGAFVAIGIALAPIADKLLDFAINFFGYIADMDPKTLSQIVTAILGFVVASQLAAGATQFWITLKTPFHSAFGALVFLLTVAAVGFLWLYQHSEKFQAVMDKIGGFIRDHKGLFLVLVGIVTSLGGAFLMVFKVLSFLYGPLEAMRKIFAAGRVAMLAFSGPIGWIILGLVALGVALVVLWKQSETFRDIVKGAWKGLVTTVKWLWDNVLYPVFAALGKVIMWVWNTIVKPYFTFIWNYWKGLAQIFAWVWGSVLGPVFELFGAIVKTLWNKVLSPVFGWIGGKFSWLGGKFKEVYDKYLAKYVNAFMDKMEPLKSAFTGAIDVIGTAWDSLRKKVHSPIKWIIETVINKGFVDNFNKLADFFGTSHIPYLSVPAWGADTSKGKKGDLVSSGGGKITKGGSWATGGYTGPGHKYQPAGVVHADEFVIRKESTNKIRSKYGLSMLDYINRHGDLPGMGGYASGGLVAFGKKLQEMGFNVSENPAFGGVHPVHTKNSWHYRNGAIDVNYDGHGQGFETARINAILGLAKQYGLRTIWQYPGHYDHAHFDIGSGADLGNFAGAAAGHKSEMPGWISKPIDFIKGAVNKLTGKLGDNIFGRFLRAVPLKVIDFATEKIAKIIGGTGDYDLKDSGLNNPTGGVQQWRSTVLSALARVGEPASLLDVVLGRMNKESSGDPKAINLWDSNAKAGHPSKGLLQVIDPTFAAYRDKGLPNDIWNPMSNIVASLRYAKATYGSVGAAYLRGGGYADGGLVGPQAAGVADNGTMMYDNGGYLPPGLTTVLNLTGKPEPVFTSEQFSAMEGGGRGGALWNGDIRVEGGNVTAGDIADEMLWTLHRIEHGGKHAGKAG